ALAERWDYGLEAGLIREEIVRAKVAVRLRHAGVELPELLVGETLGNGALGVGRGGAGENHRDSERKSAAEETRGEHGVSSDRGSSAGGAHANRAGAPWIASTRHVPFPCTTARHTIVSSYARTRLSVDPQEVTGAPNARADMVKAVNASSVPSPCSVARSHRLRDRLCRGSHRRPQAAEHSTGDCGRSHERKLHLRTHRRRKSVL